MDFSKWINRAAFQRGAHSLWYHKEPLCRIKRYHMGRVWRCVIPCTHANYDYLHQMVSQLVCLSAQKQLSLTSICSSSNLISLRLDQLNWYELGEHGAYTECTAHVCVWVCVWMYCIYCVYTVYSMRYLDVLYSSDTCISMFYWHTNCLSSCHTSRTAPIWTSRKEVNIAAQKGDRLLHGHSTHIGRPVEQILFNYPFNYPLSSMN